MKNYLIFLVVGITYILSVLVFCSGYFKGRTEIHEKSIQVSQSFGNNVIMIVIDSLPYDFILQPEFKFYKIINARKESQTYLYRSVADLPTVTTQRVQALTTGNIPSYVAQLSAFFAQEDSILNQLQASNKSAAFFGDNTWISLFPNSFKTVYSKESFNTADFYETDNVIFEQLIPHIQKDEHNLYIAHFLGLDHVGHIYDSHHELITTKLINYSDFLLEVYENMKDEMILIITSDHGMTQIGSHGGGSSRETGTPFLVVKKNGSFNTEQSNKKQKQVRQKQIMQIDIVPTLSYFLNISIPFSNIGAIVPELINSPEICKVNLQQVLKYAQRYQQIEYAYPHKIFSEWQERIKLLLDDNTSKVCENSRLLIYEIQDQNRNSFNQFNHNYMITGIGMSAISTIIAFILLTFSMNNKNNLTTQDSKELEEIHNLVSSAVISTKILNAQSYILTKIGTLSKIIVVICVFYSFYYSEYTLFFITIYCVITTCIIQSLTQFTQQSILGKLRLLINGLTNQSKQSLLIFGYVLYELGNIQLSFLNLEHEFQCIFKALMRTWVVIFIITFKSKLNQYTLLICKFIALLLCTCVLLQFNTSQAQFKDTIFKFRSVNWFFNHNIMVFLIPLFLLIINQIYKCYKCLTKATNAFAHIYQTILVGAYLLITDNDYSAELTLWIPRILYLSTIINIIIFKDKSFYGYIILITSGRYAVIIYCIYLYAYKTINHIIQNVLNSNPLVLGSLYYFYSLLIWFSLGLRNNVSSIQFENGFIGITGQNRLLSGLLLLSYLGGPYLAIIASIGVNKKQFPTQNDYHFQVKLIYLTLFFMRVIFTEIHSYRNTNSFLIPEFYAPKCIFDIGILIYVFVVIMLDEISGIIR